MFYSQTFLARKGPLGTVWCAAHLQHRLKKSHYTSMNIPDTVDLIMFPEVPLALRMSSHLLLGVVRIYSKKVDYLFRDCNLLTTWLAKVFVSTEVDLPEDARHAPVESVTLPQALTLDEFDLEADDILDREFDHHLRNEEDITLKDQIPTGIDPYVSITFDEDVFPESTPMDVDQSTEPVSEHLRESVSEHLRETDVEMTSEAGPNNEPRDSYGPRYATEEIPEFHDPGPSNLTEPLIPDTERSNGDSPRSVPEIEIRRDAAPGLSPVSHPPFVAQEQNVTESLDETLNDKEPTIPNIDEEALNSRRHSTFELRSGSPGFAAGSEEERADFVHPSPQLALQPSPSPPPQPQARPRKRKNFDRVTVLTNKFMKDRVDDPSDTLRKRKKMPSFKVSTWRLENQSKKDQIFNEPLLTGLSDDLLSVFEKDCVASKPHLAVSDETLPEPASVSSPTRETETEIIPTSPIPVPDSTNPDITGQLSPTQQTEDVQDVACPQTAPVETVATEAQSPRPLNDDDMGIEHLREGAFPEFMMSTTPRSSPSRTEDFTTQPGSSRTDDFTAQPGSWDTGSYRTDDFSNQPGSWDTGSYSRTEPSTSANTEDWAGLRSSGLSPIREMTDEDLYFLEVDGNTPVRSPTSQGSDALTGRTRALAQYLKERSPTSSDPSGDLSLSKILEGKTRKIAARMFFETMVLKSRGLVDLQQDQPYSDIALKLMPAIYSKVQP